MSHHLSVYRFGASICRTTSLCAARCHTCVHHVSRGPPPADCIAALQVWLSYARFEASPMPTAADEDEDSERQRSHAQATAGPESVAARTAKARSVYERAYRNLRQVRCIPSTLVLIRLTAATQACFLSPVCTCAHTQMLSFHRLSNHRFTTHARLAIEILPQPPLFLVSPGPAQQHS